MGHATMDQTLGYVQDDAVNEQEFLDKFENNTTRRAIEGGASRGAERGAQTHGKPLDDAGTDEASQVS